jgi:hypothetical protein
MTECSPPIDYQAGHKSKPYRRENQPAPTPMEEGVEDCHAFTYLNETWS